MMTAVTTNTDTKPVRTHGWLARTFHWGFVAVLAYAIYKQVDNVTQLQDTALLQFEMIFAGAFLGLLALRFFYMRAMGGSAVPDDAPTAFKRLVRLGHLAIYASIGTIAASGLAIGALYGLGITAGPLMAMALGLHEASVTASYLIVAGHVIAAIFHRLKGDGIWSSMVPIWTERR